MATATSAPAKRVERAFIRVAGSDARDYLQRMVSNDVDALGVGDACHALLLTAKARIIAPVRVLRRGEDDFLVSTEPELGEPVRALLTRMRLRAQCEIDTEEHDAWHTLDGDEIIDMQPSAEIVDDTTYERLRIERGIPRWGRELDDAILPAEAGLDATYISFTKGCYPGQEPIARQHYRGKVNRRLRVFDVDAGVSPGDEITNGEKVVGRITSAADGVALGYLRTEIPDDAELSVASRRAKVRPA
jgi:tRNA-modifying protein YgfZ